MANPHLPEKIAEAFVEQYYVMLQRSPENTHRFYQESSLLGWQEKDGLVAPATTLSGINEKVMSSDFKNGTVETLTVDAQESLEGGVFVAVSGIWTSVNKNVQRKFSQSFFLAQQEKGFFVLNDILRFSNSSELTTISAVNDDDKLTEVASSTSVPNAVPSSAADNNASNPEEAVKKQDIKEAVNTSIPKDVDAKVTVLATPLSPPLEKVSPVKPAPPLEKVSPVIKPASDNAKVEAPKITYASMVAKPSLPKASPPTSPKAPVSRVGVAQRAPASSSSKPVSKASIPPSNVGAKSSIANNGAPKANPEEIAARSVYIGGLPYDITSQGVADVMKKFGPLKRNVNSVRLKKHDHDGFCCGFVEFETVDAARLAAEAHFVLFGDKEAYCTFRRNPNQGNDGRGRSPPRGGSQNGSFRGKDNGQVSNGGRRSQSGNRSDNSRPQSGNRSGNRSQSGGNGQARA